LPLTKKGVYFAYAPVAEAESALAPFGAAVGTLYAAAHFVAERNA
jgi:hypothetical protein